MAESSSVNTERTLYELWVVNPYFQLNAIFSYLGYKLLGIPLSEEAEREMCMTLARQICTSNGENQNTGSDTNSILLEAISKVDNTKIVKFLKKSSNVDEYTQCDGKPFGNYPMHYIGSDGKSVFAGY